jgi:hypothetical protein
LRRRNSITSACSSGGTRVFRGIRVVAIGALSLLQ